MKYTIALPKTDKIDLGRFCPHMHADLPKDSCVIAVDRVINGQPVRTLPLCCFAHQQVAAASTPSPCAPFLCLPHLVSATAPPRAVLSAVTFAAVRDGLITSGVPK